MDRDSKCAWCGQRVEDSYWTDHIMTLERITDEIAEIREDLDKILVPDPYSISSYEYSSVLQLKELISKEKMYSTQVEDFTSKISDARNKKIEFNKKYEIMRFWEKAFSTRYNKVYY